MQLTEAEIMRLIELKVRYIPGLDPNNSMACYDEAAHAIAEAEAEKAREGVIPLGTGIFGYHYDAFHRRYAMIDLDDALELGLPDGQRVCVTVTKLEGEDASAV